MSLHSPATVGINESSRLRIIYDAAAFGDDTKVYVIYPDDNIEDITARFSLLTELVASEIWIFTAPMTFKKAGMYSFIFIEDDTVSPPVYLESTSYVLPFTDKIDTKISSILRQRTNIDMLRNRIDSKGV
jgi:hypothetical protein